MSSVFPLNRNYVVHQNGSIYKRTGQKLNTFEWGKKDAGTGLPYLGVSIGSKCYLIHRVVAITFIPNPSNHNQVDHIDKNIYNNHKNNLRWMTHGENRSHSTRNRIRRDNGKYKGVYRHGPHWRVIIRKNGKCYGFGTYVSTHQAARVYNEHIHDFHPFAPLNTIEED